MRVGPGWQAGGNFRAGDPDERRGHKCLLDKVGIRQAANHNGQVDLVAGEIGHKAGHSQIKVQIRIFSQKPRQKGADNLAAERHGQGHGQSAMRCITKSAQLGAGRVHLFADPHRMLVEQRAICRQGKFTRPAQEQMYADIIFQPADDTAQA